MTETPKYLQELVENQDKYGAKDNIRLLFRNVASYTEDAAVDIVIPSDRPHYFNDDIEALIRESAGSYADKWRSDVSVLWYKLIEKPEHRIFPDDDLTSVIGDRGGKNETIRRPIKEVHITSCDFNKTNTAPEWLSTYRNYNSTRDLVLAGAQCFIGLEVVDIKHSKDILMPDGKPLSGVVVYEPQVVLWNGKRDDPEQFDFSVLMRRTRIWDEDSTDRINRHLERFRQSKLTWYWDKVEKTMKPYEGGLVRPR